MTFSGIHKSYEKYDSYTFKENEVLKNKPIYLGFSVLELSEILMYETYNDELQPYVGQEKLKLDYMASDSSLLTIEKQNIIHDLTNLEDLFDFSNLNENQELFSNKNKKVLTKFTIECPEIIWIDEIVCLRAKAHSFKCGNKNVNNLKGNSKSCSKNIKFDEYKK